MIHLVKQSILRLPLSEVFIRSSKMSGTLTIFGSKYLSISYSGSCGGEINRGPVELRRHRSKCGRQSFEFSSFRRGSIRSI